MCRTTSSKILSTYQDQIYGRSQSTSSNKGFYFAINKIKISLIDRAIIKCKIKKRWILLAGTQRILDWDQEECVICRKAIFPKYGEGE